MSLPDNQLEPTDEEVCEECGASWHDTAHCPVRRNQAAIDRMEERRKDE